MSQEPERPKRLVDSIRKHISSGSLNEKECAHIHEIQSIQPGSGGCEECLQTGDTWVHLRMCMTCGHIGCCNDSKNRHATQHFQATQHPIMKSLEPGEDWMWCFVDETRVSKP